MMEKAVFIGNLGKLKHFNAGYSRIYFGNEFCERLIPQAPDLKTAYAFAGKRKVGFSLVTPYVTNAGLAKLKLLLGWLKREKINCEVIVNDWGILRLIDAEYPVLTPVLGRLLTKQKRGPGLKRLLKSEPLEKYEVKRDPDNPKIKEILFPKRFPSGMDAYYRGSNASSVPVIHEFLAGRRVTRIELDNIEQGLSLELSKDNLRASVYVPYAYITTTFFCPTAGCADEKLSPLRMKPCKQECQRFVFHLRHKSIDKVLLLKGNTQFYKNTRMNISEWEKSGVDRIVYEPELPM